MSGWSAYERYTVGPDELASHRMERRLLERVDAPAPARSPRRAIALVSIAVATAAGLVLWLARPEPASSIERPATMAIASSAYSQRVALPNTSVLVLLPQSRVDVTTSPLTGATIRVHEGTVELHVRPGPGLEWIVESGPFRIDASDATFRVRSTSDVPELSVSAGSVRLSGPGFPEDGVEISAAIETAAVAPVATPSVQTTPVFDQADAVPHAIDDDPLRSPADTPPSEPARGEDARPRWLSTMRAAIDAGDPVAAVAAMPDDFPTGRERMSATELLDAGDALAAGYRDERAERAYRLACRNRAAKACGVATFRAAILRGRAGDHEDAIALATRYLDDHPNGSLAREVLGRRLQWRSASGLVEAARADADLYLARWPKGPNAALARRILDERAPER